MKIHLLYFHRNPITKEIFYVGIGKGNRARVKSNRTVFWKRYVKKYGNPIIEIVHENLSLEEACQLEQKYINEFGRINYEPKGKLVNRSIGGELTALGYKHTESAREKISARSKTMRWTEERKKAHIERHTGMKMSAEANRKNSEAKKSEKHPCWGKPRSTETRKRISAYKQAHPESVVTKRTKVLDTSTGTIYNSITEAAQHSLYKECTICAMLSGKKFNRTPFIYADQYKETTAKQLTLFQYDVAI